MKKHEDIGMKIITGLAILVLLAGVLGIRLMIAGGDVGCVFSQDPAICAAVKSVGGD